ncbi:MAG TPA: ABC transporter permease [Acidimicrobiales bacterium]|nr:ABC transporter permease [Acidimicrobiales bacterium]
MAAVKDRSGARYRSSVWLGRTLILVGLLAFFEVAPGRWLDELLVAQPSAIGRTLGEWMGLDGGDAVLWGAIRSTLGRAAGGLIIGTVLGLVAAFLVWRSKHIANLFEPVAAVVNSVPRIVLVPLFILWLGSGLAPIMVYVVGTAFFPIFYNVLQGLRSSDRVMLDSLRVMGAQDRDLLSAYLVPHSREYALAALMISAPLTLVSTIVGEMLMSAGGLGGLLVASRNDFDTDGIYAATLVAASLGVVTNVAVRSWNTKQRSRALEAEGL